MKCRPQRQPTFISHICMNVEISRSRPVLGIIYDGDGRMSDAKEGETRRFTAGAEKVRNGNSLCEGRKKEKEGERTGRVGETVARRAVRM